MNEETKTLLALQVNQLSRLMNTKKISLPKALVIIFSDKPSISLMIYIIRESEKIDSTLYCKLVQYAEKNC